MFIQEDKENITNHLYNNNKSEVVNQQYQNTEDNLDQKKRNRNMSGSVDGNSRRFSFFSKQSFATQQSFLFGTRFSNKSLKSVPKVNISNIFKTKASLYLDEALAYNFDDLLDKGYDLVSNKKQERDAFIEQEQQMRSEIQELEKEIVPLINSISKKNEQIQHQQEIKRKYELEIQQIQQEIQDLQNYTQKRVEDCEKSQNEYTNQIQNIQQENNQIRNEIHINKIQHKQSMDFLTKEHKSIIQEQENLQIKLKENKKQYEDKKLVQADRLRKMENKSKMFIGILKH